MTNSERLLQIFKPVLGPDHVLAQMFGFRADDGLLELELLPRVLFGFLEVVKLETQFATPAVSFATQLDTTILCFVGIRAGLGEAPWKPV